MGDRYATMTPHSRDGMFWGYEFGERNGRTEDEARRKLVDDIAVINPDHIFINAAQADRGVFYLWCHVGPAA